ncbi:hypothetical protein BPNPMPFG_007695 (plasmid) [Mesorhizobium sp. AR07]|uniref:hypothetical protein n=1 Tax=Mesorhizobium sp. AR07 TaxID=2865838 RepID=UPI00215F1332|nr:hypothetical protein [Mesorhizobium sp. AR07]UVK48069.1 hypothetical protein BPNPMPFG_007695 [Mesorhizobium sp. AR07]
MVDRLKVLPFELMVKRGLHARSHKHQKEKRSMKHYVGPIALLGHRYTVGMSARS